MTILFFSITVFLICPNYGQSSETSRIATFNIQNLGPVKMSKPDVVQTLVKIISRYDIVLIQEVQDRTGKSIPKLLNALNYHASSPEMQFNFILSKPSGKKIGEKEQYAILYRPELVDVLRYELYQDSNDFFTRPPLLAEVKYKTSDLPRFVICNVHIKPDVSANKKTFKEIGHLLDVYNYVKSKWANPNMLLAGDFNGDGRYMRKGDWANLPLRQNTDTFLWLVSDDADTTVGNSDMAYDRIIVTGSKLQKAVLVQSVHPYRFDENPNVGRMTQKEVLTISGDKLVMTVISNFNISTVKYGRDFDLQPPSILATLFFFPRRL